jgi:hypothetical protein
MPPTLKVVLPARQRQQWRQVPPVRQLPRPMPVVLRRLLKPVLQPRPPLVALHVLAIDLDIETETEIH